MGDDPGTDLDRAIELTADAAERYESGDLDGAETGYRAALELLPANRPALFDLGLLCKNQDRWAESLEFNLRALDLASDEGDPAFWNAGIAATALHDWETARRMWQGYGLVIPDGSGPIETDGGPCPVRLNPSGDQEVVWGVRIDPARVVLTNIPFPASGHRWRDCVLHDGVPNGFREWNGNEYPVFDELERWEASPFPTTQADVRCASPEALDDLAHALRLQGFAGEDWTANVQWLCEECSVGTVHAHRGDVVVEADERFYGIAGDPDSVARIVESWVSAGPDRFCDELTTFD
jgi:tetratricopeptide (TPR) repeat protein